MRFAGLASKEAATPAKLRGAARIDGNGRWSCPRVCRVELACVASIVIFVVVVAVVPVVVVALIAFFCAFVIFFFMLFGLVGFAVGKSPIVGAIRQQAPSHKEATQRQPSSFWTAAAVVLVFVLLLRFLVAAGPDIRWLHYALAASDVTDRRSFFDRYGSRLESVG